MSVPGMAYLSRTSCAGDVTPSTWPGRRGTGGSSDNGVERQETVTGGLEATGWSG